MTRRKNEPQEDPNEPEILDRAVVSDEVETPLILPRYQVCKGRSITSLKGILSEGDEVQVKYLNAGEESLKYLIECGAVKDNESS